MAKVEQFIGLEAALKDDLLIMGYSDMCCGINLKVVKLFDSVTHRCLAIEGLGNSIEQALCEADLFCSRPDYQGCELEDFPEGLGLPFRSDLDDWIDKYGSVNWFKVGSEILCSVFGSDNNISHYGRGKTLIQAVDETFPGAAKNLQKFHLSYSPRTIAPHTIPHRINLADFVPEGPLNSKRSCTKFYLIS